MNLYLKSFLLFHALIQLTNSEVILASNGDKLDLYEGVYYQLINKKSGKQLIPHESADACAKESFSVKYAKLLFFSSASGNKIADNVNHNYELTFITNAIQNKFMVTIEKSEHLDYYRLRESNTVTNFSCPLTQTPGGCGSFVCLTDDLWKPQIYADRYNFVAQFTDFAFLGDTDHEFESKRTKLTIVEGEVIHNRRKQAIDHFVTNYYLTEEYKEKVSVDFDTNFTLTVLPKITNKKYRIILKIPVTGANNTAKKYVSKNFNFPLPSYDTVKDYTRRYAHLTLDRITIEPFECIEYHSYADIIDHAVLRFEANAKITAKGPYGSLGITTTKFPVEFSRSLLKDMRVKLPETLEVVDGELTFTVTGNLTTSVVLGFSYSVKTVTGEPICEDF